MPGQPKYQTVAATLRREIAEGVFGEGQLLMTEEELKGRFGVSRQLIRRFQQHAAALQQHSADIREFCSMTGAVKKHHVQLFLQLLHGIAKCGRNASQFVCRSSKTTASVYCVHDA